MDEVIIPETKYMLLKRTLQFVFSISVISFFLCCSSGFTVHPHSFNAYFSTCLFSMFTHTLERKYMFLLCNAILAFLAKTKPPPLSHDEHQLPIIDQVQMQQEEQGGDCAYAQNKDDDDDEKEEQGIESDEAIVTQDNHEEEEVKKEDTTMATNELEVVNTDELNKKFEEFIRKMKEEIRIEAQRQLIVV